LNLVLFKERNVYILKLLRVRNVKQEGNTLKRCYVFYLSHFQSLRWMCDFWNYPFLL